MKMMQIGLAVVAASIVGLVVGGALIAASTARKEESSPAQIAATVVAGGATSELEKATAAVVAQATGIAAAAKSAAEIDEAVATAEAGSTTFPEVVARVDGVELLGKNLAARIAMIEAEPAGRQPRASVQEALDAMITEELWVQEAAARGLLCSEDEAKKAYEATFEGVDPTYLSQVAQYPNIDPRKIVDDPSELPALERACALVNAKKAMFAEAGAAANGAEGAANVDYQKVLDDYIAAARQKANIEILLPP